MLRFIILLLALYVAACDCAMAESNEDFVLYSDICAHSETGDLLGTRIGLINLFDSTYVFFQVAEGRLESPQVSKLSTGGLGKGKLSFPVSIAGKAKMFQGTVTNAAIIGNFDDQSFGPTGNSVFHLKRTSALDKTLPRCR
jgi:hypothetical protein